MKIVVRGPVSRYELENLTRLFFADAGILPEGGSAHRLLTAGEETDCVLVRLSARQPLQKGAGMLAALRRGGKTVFVRGRLDDPVRAEYELCRLLYGLLRQVTGKRPPWGMLTGVRPVRLLHDGVRRGSTEEQVCRALREEYDVSEEKLSLALQTARNQRRVLQEVLPQDYSLYVSIPFCPSRCSYCSFVSRTIEKSRALVQPYVETLCRELAAISAQAARLGLRLRTVYIGGGTPTSLSAQQLRTVMQCIRDFFPLEIAQEYTVEAGRPDCTDEEKLAVIRQLGATRISINPQTLQDSVLQHIGRRHSAQDILDCYAAARRVGHTNINMDLIAGLPSDTVSGFDDTLRRVLALRPENITVHTLTLKRASNLVVEEREESYDNVSAMLQSCRLVTENGYQPYYLYRQKGTLQNLENTGYCLPGYEGLYNIYIMEELHSIFSAGAGGVTKLKHADASPDAQSRKIERIFNYKYPLEYVRDFDAILEKKQEVDAFYGR